jgi:Ca-activated chloride channel family protein
MSTTQASFAPRSAATGEPVRLAMQRLWLTGQVLPAGARIITQHVFRSEEKSAMEVIYSFPLSRDAALRRFRITGTDFESQSELQETEAAVKAYEQGIAQGSLSTLARLYGDGIVNLTVGNIRPGETVTVWLEILAGVELQDAGFRFRFPFTLAPTYHARAKTAVLSPGEGEMELPSDQFGDVILPRFRKDASALHQVGFELAMDSRLELDEIASPSHPVRVKQDGARHALVALATGHDVPNRDLVLDGRFKSIEPQILSGRDHEGKGRFAVILPSTSFGPNPESPRRVVILLDRSGSMQGEPIAQARKAIDACLGALSENDSFGLVAFDNVPEVLHQTLQRGTRENRDQAHAFLNRIDARGGTRLVDGFLAAVKLLLGENGERGGDILIMTDGQVSGTETILADARTAGVRLHCLGIGSASQDRFLTLLARETGGVSRFVTPRERVDLSAVDLFASIGRPVVSGLRSGANIQPAAPSFVFSGTPVLLFGEGEEIELTWEGGRLSLPVSFHDNHLAETLWLLQGGRLITDWESRYPSTEALAPLAKRKESRVAARLLELSQTYGLASREMSLVAVVKRAGDRPGELPETRVVPVGMAENTAFDAYFGEPLMLASAIPPQVRVAQATMKLSGSKRPFASSAPPGMPAPAQAVDATSEGPTGLLRSFFGGGRPPKPKTGDEILFDLASRMDSDGGMPGQDTAARAISTVVALMAFVSQGHTLSTGAFRSHVARLKKFLESLKDLSGVQQQLVAAVVQRTDGGIAPAGDWLSLALKPGDHWKAVMRLVKLGK